MGKGEQNRLISELTQGRELAKQLQIYLNLPSSSHDQTRGMLVQQIITSCEKALSMLNFSSSPAGEPQPTTGPALESPPSLSGSPRIEDSDRDIKDQELKDSFKKRKTFPRWVDRVRINPATGLEGTLDDGFSWRKYGQKNILGAKYPRGYYRCAYRNFQGCLATKQVQRSSEDPSTFEITYCGNHICAQASKVNIFPPLAQAENQEAKSNSVEPQQQQQYYEPQLTQQQPEDALLNLRQSLKVDTENLDIHQPPFPSFNFPSTSNVNAENLVFSPSTVINNNGFTGNFLPSFLSSAATGTLYFSPSPSGINSSFHGKQNFQNPKPSELNEIISAATSATNSATVGSDYQFGNVEYDPNFLFDNSNF